jgi:hypothetical protein
MEAAARVDINKDVTSYIQRPTQSVRQKTRKILNTCYFETSNQLDSKRPLYDLKNDEVPREILNRTTLLVIYKNNYTDNRPRYYSVVIDEKVQSVLIFEYQEGPQPSSVAINSTTATATTNNQSESNDTTAAEQINGQAAAAVVNSCRAYMYIRPEDMQQLFTKFLVEEIYWIVFQIEARYNIYENVFYTIMKQLYKLEIDPVHEMNDDFIADFLFAQKYIEPIYNRIIQTRQTAPLDRFTLGGRNTKDARKVKNTQIQVDVNIKHVNSNSTNIGDVNIDMSSTYITKALVRPRYRNNNNNNNKDYTDDYSTPVSTITSSQDKLLASEVESEMQENLYIHFTRFVLLHPVFQIVLILIFLLSTGIIVWLAWHMCKRRYLLKKLDKINNSSSNSGCVEMRSVTNMTMPVSFNKRRSKVRLSSVCSEEPMLHSHTWDPNGSPSTTRTTTPPALFIHQRPVGSRSSSFNRELPPIPPPDVDDQPPPTTLLIDDDIDDGRYNVIDETKRYRQKLLNEYNKVAKEHKYDEIKKITTMIDPKEPKVEESLYVTMNPPKPVAVVGITNV